MNDRRRHEDGEALIANEHVGALDDSEAADLPLLADLLADPSTWSEPRAGLDDEVVHAVAEATPAPPKTAARRRRRLVTSLVGVAAAIVLISGAVLVVRQTTSPDFRAQLTAAGVRADVAAARRAGANLVLVYPHWGTEYDPTPFAGQQALAHAVIDAGADMVIGNHAHWVGAMELYKGKPIWYALGNFVFDQTWSEPTMEGMLLEMTFRGRTLVQVRLHPTIILDGAQPNFLDPAGDGRVVLGQLFEASKGMLPW